MHWMAPGSTITSHLFILILLSDGKEEEKKRTKLVNLCHLARVKTSCLNTSPLKKSKKSAQIYFRVSLRVSLLSICVNVMTPLVLGSQLVPKILQNTAKKRLNQAKLLPERFPEVVSLPNSFLLQTSVSSQGLTYTDGC